MTIEINLTLQDGDALWEHLFPGDHDEHAAIMLAGLHGGNDRSRLLVRELHLLESNDFIPGEHGYRQISPAALARLGNRAAAEGLAFISCHSHPGATNSVSFSRDDLAGHQRVFPYLLDIVDGQSVVGVALGIESAVGEVWRSRDAIVDLDGIRIIGSDLRKLADAPRTGNEKEEGRFDRQARMFGAAGQAELKDLRVGVVGLGGGGSLICEQLAHLGVGVIRAIDFDVVKEHNLSRIVGATQLDANEERKKVEVARRLARQIDPTIEFDAIDGDIADRHIAEQLTECDFIFLATDSITSRHVANAIVHSHFIPMVQIGAKVDLRGSGEIESVYVAVRPVFPGLGCLYCAGLIDPEALQREQATDTERRAQNYLDLPETVDPSVITLNGVGASAATNTMLMSAVGLADRALLDHRLFDARHGTWLSLQDQRDHSCPWCGGGEDSRFGLGDRAELPVRLASSNSDRTNLSSKSDGSPGLLRRILRRMRLA
jgi:ThiF family protein